MAQNKLTATAVNNLKAPGKYGDGGGLYLFIDKAGGKRWLHIYQLNGARREMGLGPLSGVSLAAARDRRDDNVKLIHAGKDPLDEKRKAAEAAAAERAREEFANAIPFFEVFAKEVGKGLALKRERTRELWLASVASKNTPKLTGVPVNEINTDMLIETLRPIWDVYPIKAKKLRQKIEHILNVARVRLYMGPLDTPYQNPAQWEGHLKLLLPKRKHKTKHYTALPYDEIGGFMAQLSARKGVPARALEFSILTVPRGHEVRFMRVKNLDLEHALWRIPDEDQKSDRQYLLPLSDRAIEILREALKVHGDRPDPEAVVFPCLERGPRLMKELSNQAMRHVVERMGYKDRATPHGFRSTFRDYMGDCTDHPREVVEHCLSHTGLGDETELAYRRSDALDKRRKVLVDWAARCADVKADKVVAFTKTEPAQAVA